MAAAPWGLGIILIRPTGKVQSLLKVRPKIKSFDTLCEVPLLRRAAWVERCVSLGRWQETAEGTVGVPWGE